MPRHDYIPDTEQRAIAWSKHFAQVAEQHLAETGLTQQEIDELKAANDEYLQAKKAQMDAHTKARVATTTKDQARQKAMELARRLAQGARNNSLMTNELLVALRLTPKEPRRRRVLPIRPEGLSASVRSNGAIALRWDRSGNEKGTTYVIEARVGFKGAYRYVGMTHKPSFVDYGRTPGVVVEYRVYAQRTEYRSLACGGAMVYGSEPWVGPNRLVA